MPFELLDDALAEPIGVAHLGMELAVEPCALAPAVDEPPQKPDPAAVKVVQADGVAAVLAAQVRVAAKPIPGALEHGRGSVEIAHVALPLDAVPPPVAPG